MLQEKPGNGTFLYVIAMFADSQCLSIKNCLQKECLQYNSTQESNSGPFDMLNQGLMQKDWCLQSSYFWLSKVHGYKGYVDKAH